MLLLSTHTPVQAQSAELTALARETLRGLQDRSIRANREFCGLIGRDTAGRLVVSRIVRGRRASCRYPNPPDGVEVIATFHTHGAFLEAYDNEVPSVLDVEGEMSTGTHGFVSTPGGRFWYVDGRRGRARLICGPKCMPWDSRFVPGLAGTIAPAYSLQDLRIRQDLW